MRRDVKQMVLKARRALKDTGFSITEDLTSSNMRLLNRVNNSELIDTSWSINGKIYGIPLNPSDKIQFHLFDSVSDTIINHRKHRTT
jgi:hypothetical protein